MSPVVQIKLKRAGVGLRACDPDRACPGFTLFAPKGVDSTVYLIDLAGEIVHAWYMPYPPGLYGYLTERGTLVYNGRIESRDGSFISSEPWKGGALLEVDWRGDVLWEVRHPDHHQAKWSGSTSTLLQWSDTAGSAECSMSRLPVPSGAHRESNEDGRGGPWRRRRKNEQTTGRWMKEVAVLDPPQACS